MPRGRPKKQPEAAANGDKGISKMDAVRTAMRELGIDAMPAEIQKFIKAQFNVDMDLAHISTYKTQIKKEGTPSAIIRAKKPGRPPAVSKTSAEGATFEEIRAVKELADRIGFDKVRELARVLGE